MSKDRAVFSTQLSQGDKGSRGSSQTFSILKPPKHRGPLQELDFRLNTDEDATSSSQSYNKRVSFHRSVQTKEFHVEEAVTNWGLTYEETFKSSSDSSHQTDSSSCPSGSKVTSFDGQLNSHSLKTPIPPNSDTIRDVLREREGMDRCENNLRFHAINTDDGDSDDEKCLPLMHIFNQSNCMDFTKPLDVNLNLNQNSLFDNNNIGLTEPLKYHIGLNQKCNFGLSTVLDQELKTTEEICTKLGGELLDTHSEFQDYTKSQNKAKEGFRGFVGNKSASIAESDCSVKGSEERSVYLSVPNDICNRKVFFNKFPTTHSKEIPNIDGECCIYFPDTGIPTQINESDMSFTQVVSCNQNKYELDNNGPTFQPSPDCAINLDEYENSALNQSMELTKTLREIKFFNNMEMFKSDLPYDRIQETGKTVIRASEFGTSDFQSFNKIKDSGKSQMMDVSSLLTHGCIQGSGITNSAIPNRVCLHNTNDGNVQNMDSAKFLGNPVLIYRTETDEMELTCERTQTSNPIEVTNHNDMELTKEIKRKEMCNPGNMNKYVSDTALTSESRQKDMSRPMDVSIHSDSDSDMELTNGIETCNRGEVNKYITDMELTSESRKKEMSRPVEVSRHTGNDSDMEFTNVKECTETCNRGDVNKYVEDMELTSESRLKQMSRPMEVSSHILNTTDMELTSGIKWIETSHPGDVNKRINIMELTSESRQKEMSRPVEVSSHIPNTTDMELTSGIKRIETSHPGDVNRHMNIMEVRSESRKKEMSRPVEVSRHTGNDSDMEFTNVKECTETCNRGDVNKYVEDMELTSESRLKQMSRPMEVSSHILNTTDMELTSGIKWIETSHPGDVNKRINIMELTSESRQKEMSRPVEVSSHIPNTTDMELTSGIKRIETSHPGDVNRHMNIMEVRSESRKKEMSRPVEVSRYTGNDSDMEFTNVKECTETCNRGEVNKYVEDMELTSESRLKQMSRPMGVSSHILNTTDMELTSGIKRIETSHPGDVNKYMNIMELTSESRKKEMSRPVEVSSHINTTDMEITSGIKRTETSHPGYVNKCITDMELTSESRKKEMSRPVEVSRHTGNDSDMEFTNVKECTETCNRGEVNKYVEDMELTSESRLKQMSRPMEVFSHILNSTDMELTSGIKRIETSHPGDVNKHMNIMELTSESRQKEMSRPVEVSSYILNTTNMEITSGIKRIETSHPGDVNKCITDMELTSESRKKEMSRPVEVSRHTGNDSDMEFTNVKECTETCNHGDVNKYVEDMELTSESRLKQMSRPMEVSSHILNTTDMELTSGIKRIETSHPGDVNKHMNIMELTSESRKKEMSRPVEVSSHILNTTDMEITSGIKRIETSHPGDVNKCITDMELTSESRKKEMSRPVEVSRHTGNDSDMEFTNVKECTETCNRGEVNKYVEDMELTSESRLKQMSRPMEVSSHIVNTTDMELTSGIKRIETSHPGDVNKHMNIMELTSESRQKEMSRPVEVSSHILNTTDMELTSGIKRIETSHPGDVNKRINTMELTSENRQNQMPAEFTTRNMGNLEFINEVRDRTFINPSTVTNLSTRDITDMKLLKVNEKGIYAQSDEFNEFASSNDMVNRHIVHHKQSGIHMETCSGTNNASGTEMRNKTHRVAFSPTSLSKEGQTEDVTDVSYHSLKSRNMKTTSNVKELHSIDSEITQHSEPIALINLSANISTDKMSPSEPSTVHALGSNEKLDVRDNPVTLVKEIDDMRHNQFSETKHSSMDGRYCEQIRSVLDIKKVNESVNCNSMEFNVENNISSNTSVPDVGLNLSIPSNMKKLEKRSPECNMKLSHVSKVNQELVNGSVQNVADKLSLSQCGYGLEDSKSSSDELTEVCETCRGDSRVTEENFSTHRLLTGTNTYTSRTTEVKKFDNISNSVYHDNKQFQNAKEYSVDNIQMFRSHEEDSFILEELGCKHEHTIKQPDLNEYAESSDLCVKVDIETQKNSMESTEMEQNLHCSLLQITLTSIPDEMELSVVKNLSFETNESCEELVDRVTEADEIIRESMCMTSYECAVPGNSQSAQSDSEETALLPQELNISKNPANGPVTTKQKSAKEHSEAETIANRQRCNLNGMCAKSRINQTDEKIKRKELLKDTNEVVPMSSVEEQIKAKEQRSDCLWNIKEMSDTLWSFQFLYKSLVLILKLDPCEMQDSGKLVTDIQLISHATEKADPLVKFVHNVLLQKFQIQALDSTCKTTLDVAEVLERISAEVKKTKIFVKDFIELETLDLIQINNNCVSFDIANLDIHTWFRINMKIDTWENISPADVSVENVVGNVREYEIKNLVTAATRGPNCLRDYVRIIKEYVKVLAKNKCI